MDSLSLRWQRIGYQQDVGEREIQWAQRDLARIGKYVDLPGVDSNEARYSDDGREEAMWTYVCIIQLEHLQFPHQFDEVKRMPERLAELGVDYFHGDWRVRAQTRNHGRIGRRECRERLAWLDPFRYSMLGAALSGRWDAAEQIAAYVDPDLFYDDGLWDRTKDDNLAMKYLAAVVTGWQEEFSADDLESLRRSRRKRPKLVVQTLDAIARKNVNLIESSFIAYMEQYLKQEHRPHVRLVTSIDGGILWGLAYHRCRELAMLPAHISDYVMTPTTIGLR